MNKRQAKRWVTAWASNVLTNFIDCDTILLQEDGEMRPHAEIVLLQDAVEGLCAELDKRCATRNRRR